VESGVARLEVDVRFMADDSMVICHDGSIDALTTSTGRLDQLNRGDLANVRYRSDEAWGLCFLEEVVDVMRGSSSLLQVDLKLLRMISAERAERLLAALAPLGDRLIVGSQAHWNLRRLRGVPIAFDPSLHMRYEPGREAPGIPRTMGVHGMWDDMPIAANPHLSAVDYLESRFEDLRGILPAATEWMVDIATILQMGQIGLPLGQRLAEHGCGLAAWTLRGISPETPELLRRLFDLGTTAVITDDPVAAWQAASLL